MLVNFDVLNICTLLKRSVFVILSLLCLCNVSIAQPKLLFEVVERLLYVGNIAGYIARCGLQNLLRFLGNFLDQCRLVLLIVQLPVGRLGTRSQLMLARYKLFSANG